MYLKSLYPYELEVSGVFLPKARYTDQEQQAGKKSVVEITKEQFAKLKQDKVFKSLFDHGKYSVYDNLPTQFLTPVERLKLSEENHRKELENKTNELLKAHAENRRLQDEINSLKDKITNYEKAHGDVFGIDKSKEKNDNEEKEVVTKKQRSKKA